MLDGKDDREDGGGFDEEWEKLGAIFGEDETKAVHRARGGWCSGDELGEMLAQVLAAGGEGIVVRHEKQRDYAKIKPRLTIDAAIMGYVEGSFDGKIGVRNILVGLTYPANGQVSIFQTLARTGSGIDDKMSVDLLERLKGLKTAPPLLLNDSEGREVHFVKPEIIVEIDGEDWIRSRSDGRPIRTQAFSWDAVKGVWSFAGIANCPRMIFPTFSKLRDDKSVKDSGARIAQAQENAVPPAKPAEPKTPEIIERQVYRKGKDAIRKFILAKRGGNDVVPYIFCFTDYSSGRKEPLKVTTEYAFTETRARALLKGWIAENVKKGWEKQS
jgi:hypothetical protein